MENAVKNFINRSKAEGLETLICIPEIEKGDPRLVVDIHTWRPSHARQQLEDLKLAIDELLDAWNTRKYLMLPIATEERPTHYRVEWDLIHHVVVDRSAGKNQSGSAAT